MAKNSKHTGFSNRHGEILEALPAEHAFAFTFRKLYYLIRQSDLEVFCRLIPSWLSVLPAGAKLGLIARLVYSRACSQLHPHCTLTMHSYPRLRYKTEVMYVCHASSILKAATEKIKKEIKKKID